MMIRRYLKMAELLKFFFFFLCISPLLYTTYGTQIEPQLNQWGKPAVPPHSLSAHLLTFFLLWQYLMAKSLFSDLARIRNDERPFGVYLSFCLVNIYFKITAWYTGGKKAQTCFGVCSQRPGGEIYQHVAHVVNFNVCVSDAPLDLTSILDRLLSLLKITKPRVDPTQSCFKLQ